MPVTEPASTWRAEPTVRFASKQVRAYLYALQEGSCALCPAPLGDGFHVDHRQPWCKGGRTCLPNLQALCPACHGAKTRLDFVRAPVKPPSSSG